MPTVEINCNQCGYSSTIFDTTDCKDDTVFDCPGCGKRFLIWKDFFTGKFRATQGSELDYVLNPGRSGVAKY